MFDFKFDWQKNLETGNEDIDTQHKQLFRIGRDLEQLLRIQCIGVTDQQLLDIVCGLRDFTAYHFYIEEKMMNDCCYGKYSEHKKFHKRCSDFVMSIDVPKLKKDPQAGIRRIKDEVQDWIINHVLTDDMHMAKAYKKYMDEEQARKNKKPEIPDEAKFGAFVGFLDVTKFYLYKDQTCKGHIVGVYKESTKEFAKLSALERNTYMGDIAKAAKIVKKLFDADAVSYINAEDIEEKIAFHIIPKYKDTDWFGQLAKIGEQAEETDVETYASIFGEVSAVLHK